MTDFEKMIRDMVANGAKAEDIAKATGDTLNAIQKEKKAQKSERDRAYEKLEEEFHQSYAEGRMDLHDVGVLAALVTAPDYPNWTEKDLVEFVEAVEDTIRMRAAIVGKSLMDGLTEIFDIAGNIMDEKGGGKHLPRNEEKKCADHKSGCTCGGTCKAATKSDEQRVKDFLKQLDTPEFMSKIADGKWRRLF